MIQFEELKKKITDIINDSVDDEPELPNMPPRTNSQTVAMKLITAKNLQKACNKAVETLKNHVPLFFEQDNVTEIPLENGIVQCETKNKVVVKAF